jgi:hypothetical protein
VWSVHGNGGGPLRTSSPAAGSMRYIQSVVDGMYFSIDGCCEVFLSCRSMIPGRCVTRRESVSRVAMAWECDADAVWCAGEMVF